MSQPERTITPNELKQILAKHQEWLADNNKGERANLSSADLRFADLSSANLSSADLSFANLRFANLSSANLSFADLRSANLSSANLSSANLSSADLSSADLSFADLRSANLRYANLRFADLSSANLLIFQFNRNVAYFTFDGTMRIGCECMPISEWLIGYEEIGQKNNYSPQEIKAYGQFIKMCAELFEEQNK